MSPTDACGDAFGVLTGHAGSFGPGFPLIVGAMGVMESPLHAVGSHLAPFLLWLLHNSAAAAAVAVVVLLTQVVFGRWLSPAWRYRLWGLVLLRLLLPAVPPGPAWAPTVESILPSGKLTAWAQSWSARPAPPPRGVAMAARHGTSADRVAPLRASGPGSNGGPVVTVTYGPLSPGARDLAAAQAPAGATSPPGWPAGPTWTIAGVVWLVGVALLLCRLIGSNAALARRLHSATPMTDPAVLALLEDCCRRAGVARRPPLLVSDVVATPAAAGVLRPRLLLPPGLLPALSAAELRDVLLHELVHVRRRDVACNWLLAVAQTIHWFNPILWPAFARLRADREAARDAMVLKILAAGAGHRSAGAEAGAVDDVARGYARTLLKLAESIASRPPLILAQAAGFVGIIHTNPAPHPLAPGLFGGRGALRRRLHMISHFPETRRLRFAGPILALVLAGCALTGAQAGAPSGPADSPPQQSPRPDGPAPAPVAAAPPTRPAEDVPALIAETRRLVERRDYAAALAQVDRILSADPANDYAVGVRLLLEDKIGRGRHSEEAGKAEKVTKALRELLDRTLPEINFDGVAFGDAVDFLRDLSGANIYVNWKALEAAGVDRKVPVSARMRNVRFSKALDVILDNVSSPRTKVGYVIDDGVLTISTGDNLNRNVVTRVYDIRDLLVSVPNFEPEEEKTTAAPSPSTAPAPAPSSQPLKTAPREGASPATRPAENPERPKSRQTMVDDLTRLITGSIAPDSWQGRGGSSIGSIKELGGQFVITTTPEHQEQIANLLQQMRENHGLQVTVECRFVSCDQKAVRELLAEWKKATAPGKPPQTGKSDQAEKSGAEATVAFLDETQVNQILRAGKAETDSTILTAPRMTLFNGQRAYVRVSSQRAYVRDYTTVRTDAGETRYEPVYATADAGVLMDVQATVSADRKFVTLTLRPKISALLGMTEAAWPSRPTGSSLVVQQPQLKVSELQTTASVPNQGTLLLGGLEDPGIAAPKVGTAPATAPAAAPTTQPAGRPNGLFLLVKPTIIRQARE